MLMNTRSPIPYQAKVGMDWADQKHDVFVHFANGDSYRLKIESRPEAIQEWLLELRSACAQGKIAIALFKRDERFFQNAIRLDPSTRYFSFAPFHRQSTRKLQ